MGQVVSQALLKHLQLSAQGLDLKLRFVGHLLHSIDFSLEDLQVSLQNFEVLLEASLQGVNSGLQNSQGSLDGVELLSQEVQLGVLNASEFNLWELCQSWEFDGGLLDLLELFLGLQGDISNAWLGGLLLDHFDHVDLRGGGGGLHHGGLLGVDVGDFLGVNSLNWLHTSGLHRCATGGRYHLGRSTSGGWNVVSLAGGPSTEVLRASGGWQIVGRASGGGQSLAGVSSSLKWWERGE